MLKLFFPTILEPTSSRFWICLKTNFSWTLKDINSLSYEYFEISWVISYAYFHDFLEKILLIKLNMTSIWSFCTNLTSGLLIESYLLSSFLHVTTKTKRINIFLLDIIIRWIILLVKDCDSLWIFVLNETWTLKSMCSQTTYFLEPITDTFEKMKKCLKNFAFAIELNKKQMTCVWSRDQTWSRVWDWARS